MMSSRDRRRLPTWLLLLGLLTGHASLTTPSQAPGTNPVRPRGTGELPPPDYYGTLDETIPPVPPETPPQPNIRPSEPCNYSMCLEGQPPCSQLASSTGCLCPGVTSHRETPLPPTIKTVSREGSEVVVRWCAPYSYVMSYRVSVAGRERQEFRAGQRGGALGDVRRQAEVCVVAVNDAGTSRASCMTYGPEDDGAMTLWAGLIGGALGLLLLSSLAVLLWRHRTRRKTEARISSDPEDTELDSRGRSTGEVDV